MVTASNAAKTTLASLETKLADARSRQAELEEASKAVAYEAHAKGGSALEKLGELNDEAAKIARTIASLETAVAEARSRLSAAEAIEVDEAERAKATRALALCGAFERRGAALDELLGKFLDEFAGLSSDFKQLSSLDYPPSSWPLVAVNMRNAMIARLMFTPLQVEHLPPNRRHSFEEVINGWATSVRMRAESRLNKDAPAKAGKGKAA